MAARLRSPVATASTRPAWRRWRRGRHASSTSRRGTLTACPNCRTVSRVAPDEAAAYDVGDRVLALWGYKWYPGVVDECAMAAARTKSRGTMARKVR